MKSFAAAALAAFLATAAMASGPVTSIGDLQRGTMVTVAGTVERITDEDEFRLTDTTGTVRVYVGPNWVPANVGEAVTVEGFVDDDFGPLEIYARSLTRADGTVVTFSQRYD
jgi:uncharacterized protein YdeI (BOF family)